MSQSLAQIALLVSDYDEAISFYTQKLNFDLVEDTRLSDIKRWVIVRPKGSSQCGLLLAKAANEQQKQAIGDQTGGRVFLFLHTSNILNDYKAMKEKGVVFMGEPRNEEYGNVVVFKDLYGNLWDLIEPVKQDKTTVF